MNRVGIVNVEMGNLRSVSNAIHSLGYDFHLVSVPAELPDVSHLVIPGVGSFRAAMERICRAGLHGPIREFAAAGRPVLGVCLGMQVLASEGEEGGRVHGLDLIPGRVVRLDPDRVPAIPHVGWNEVRLESRHPVITGVPSGADFYFVHSYHLIPERPGDVYGRTDCGQAVASIVATGNVVGFQFHPEKSQRNGLRLLENFCAWDGRC